MPKYLVDTDVMIDFLRGDTKAKGFIRSNIESMILSSITVAELYSGVRDGGEKEGIGAFVEMVPVAPVTEAISIEGGLFKRDYGKSHGVGLADAIIAATAEANDAILCTLNKKHFPMVKEIKVPYRR